MDSEAENGISTSADTVRTLHFRPLTVKPTDLTDISDLNKISTSSIQGIIESSIDQGSTTPPSAVVSPTPSQGVLDCSMTSTTGTSVLVLSMPFPPSNPASIDGGSVSPSASESSLPESVSSSFFFSSSAAGLSSEEIADESEHQHQPSPDLFTLRRPTPFGQTLGSLRLLVLGQGAGNIKNILLEDNEDVVHVGNWESCGGGEGESRVLRASTDWRRGEPLRNVEIFGLEGDVDPTIIIEQPFRALNGVLHPNAGPLGAVNDLLAAPNSGLWTAMIFLTDGLTPTPLENEIISSLSAHIPLIVLSNLPPPDDPDPSPDPKLSSFAPRTALDLREGLFRSPETLALLRREAADRFMRWREVQRKLPYQEFFGYDDADEDTIRAAWELGWTLNHSREVALTRRRKREREATVTGIRAEDYTNRERPSTQAQLPAHTPFDPLHLPSLFVFSLSLFAPLKDRVICAMGNLTVQLALMGGFCVGVGVGVCVGGW